MVFMKFGTFHVLHRKYVKRSLPKPFDVKPMNYLEFDVKPMNYPNFDTSGQARLTSAGTGGQLAPVSATVVLNARSILYGGGAARG